LFIVRAQKKLHQFLVEIFSGSFLIKFSFQPIKNEEK
jgi:hypothetical protein